LKEERRRGEVKMVGVRVTVTFTVFYVVDEYYCVSVRYFIVFIRLKCVGLVLLGPMSSKAR
jgi:hypothetical protein